MTPLFEALEARDNETVVRQMVDRLLTLRVPFVPDPSAAEGFRPARAVFGKTMTVGDFLAEGKLTTEILDNALSLQLTMPNLRRHGVLETRAPDSMDDIGSLMKTAAQYHRMTYDDTARSALLSGFAGVDSDRLRTAFQTRFEMDEKTLMAFDIGGGKTVGDLVFAVRAPQPSDEEILDWAAQAAVASMTFGHLDYQPRMKNAAGYFTEAGWKKFAQGLVSVQFLDIMVAQKITLITTPAGKGSIIQQGPVEGAYAWHVILPVAIYHSTEDGDEKRQLMNLSLLITRSNQNKDGRGIADWAQIAAE
jgi:hypothetical protein